MGSADSTTPAPTGRPGVVAFYSLIHLARASVMRALREIHRVLVPGGVCLLAVHGGDGELHAKEFLGMPASIDATFFQPEEMAEYLRQAGFAIARVATRPPYEFEYQTTRVYMAAEKPAPTPGPSNH